MLNSMYVSLGLDWGNIVAERVFVVSPKNEVAFLKKLNHNARAKGSSQIVAR